MKFLLQATPLADSTSVDPIKSITDFFTNNSVDGIISTFADWALSFGGKALAAIAVFIIGKFIISKLNKGMKRIFSNKKTDSSLASFVQSLVRIALHIVLLIVVVGILGVDTSSFIAIFATAGIAIGMALSGTLQNFAGGVLMLVLKPYKVGDVIEAQGFVGIVKEIQIFHTIINTFDNKHIIIPNGPLSVGNINNYSKEPYRRVDWSFSIAYGNDMSVARRVILEMLKEDSRALFRAADMENWEEQYKRDAIESMPDNAPLHSPVVLLGSMNDSSISVITRCWVKGSDYFGLLGDITERVYNEFGAHGLEFPFPQMDVTIKQS